jgi:uncharacterized membrane protein
LDFPLSAAPRQKNRNKRNLGGYTEYNTVIATVKTRNRAVTPLQLAASIVFIALVCIVTISFTLYVPATSGYFNLGEAIIYIAALTFGPLVGALAGGVGAMIADIIVAPQFAMGTLVVKGVEGAVVGFLGKKLISQTSKSHWRIYTIILGIVIGVLLAATGAYYYSGNVEITFGIPPQTPFAIFVPTELWYILGGVVSLLVVFASYRIEPQLGWTIFSVILGGLMMVFGYFLYETLILGQVGAAFEIPVNIGQMLIGLVIATPVARFVLRSFPQLKS